MNDDFLLVRVPRPMQKSVEEIRDNAAAFVKLIEARPGLSLGQGTRTGYM
jgi:hypothetical protein